ncbi:hypothetical protein [Microbaculum marinum]|uniref:Secreted protein n=1 Tax=Microbaculum marinum TaxID=1764581 RepID=A0AAW9RVF3_9HYPH
MQLVLPATLLAGSSGSAVACIICLSAVSVTIGQKLDAADVVVLAEPARGSQGFRIVAELKGDGPVGTYVEGASDPARWTVTQGGTFLLARNSQSGRWTDLGPVGTEHADWLRRFLTTVDGPSNATRLSWPLSSTAQAAPDTTNWPARIAVVERQLESADPLVAEIAFGELARAPYDVMRTLKPVLDVEKLRNWTSDPSLAQRRDAYLLLLGIAGNAQDAAAIDRQLIDASAAHDATNLAALLAADLELRGPDRVAWIEETYLADPGRSLPEIEAALLALSVHGNANRRIPRQRVVDAYRGFIRNRPPMAGFVVGDLGEWRNWDAVPELIDALESDAVRDPAGRFAIIAYLKDSPVAQAHAAATSARQLN